MHPEEKGLEPYGIEEVQPGVCEDTFENRSALRAAGQRWRVIPPGPDDNGRPTGMIAVVGTDADGEVEQRNVWAERRPIMEDPANAWSDYLDVREYPPDAVGIPYWIWARLEKWKAWDTRPRLPGSKKSREPYLPVRCSVIKGNGRRCWGWCAEAANGGRCRAHAPGAALAANMGHAIAVSKVRIMQAMPALVDELEGLALHSDVPQVKLKAITEMMDRGGVRAGADLHVEMEGEVTVRDPAAAIRERLGSLAERLRESEARAEERRLELEEAAAPADVVEAEVLHVEEDSA